MDIHFDEPKNEVSTGEISNVANTNTENCTADALSFEPNTLSPSLEENDVAATNSENTAADTQLAGLDEDILLLESNSSQESCQTYLARCMDELGREMTAQSQLSE